MTDEHFENVLHEYTDAGNRYMLPGWAEISEKEARQLHPTLFGAADSQITFTQAELVAELERKRMRDELHSPAEGE